MRGVSSTDKDRLELRSDLEVTIVSDHERNMRLWVIIGALAMAIHASIAEIPRNKNRGRGSMWW